MILNRHGLVCISLALFSVPAAASATVSSVFTDVVCKSKPVSKNVSKNAGKKGAKVRPPPAALVCPSVAGFRLQVVHKQGRSSVNIVAPDKRVFPLNYWDVTSVGGKAEWRVIRDGARTVPIGLIMPVKAINASQSRQARAVPILAVAKVGKHTACVVKQVDVQAPGAIETARRHADGLDEICMQRPVTAMK